MEGLHCYNPPSGCNTSGKVLPIWEYGHSPECSITGGYVYRGPNVPELEGKYIYGDYCSRKIWAFEYDGITPPTNQLLLSAPGSITSFGVDQNSEVYVTSSDSIIYRFTPTITSVENPVNPTDYVLEQNYPNPFNPATTIKYQLGNDGFVNLKVFNSLGEEVAELVNQFQKAGSYQVVFSAIGGSASGGDARFSHSGSGESLRLVRSLPSGMYVYQITSGNYIESKKMLMVKLRR